MVYEQRLFYLINYNILSALRDSKCFAFLNVLTEERRRTQKDVNILILIIILEPAIHGLEPYARRNKSFYSPLYNRCPQKQVSILPLNESAKCYITLRVVFISMTMQSIYNFLRSVSCVFNIRA